MRPEYRAIDLLIDWLYIEQAHVGPRDTGRPIEEEWPGLSPEQVTSRHAPDSFRERYYWALGLPKPKPHTRPYRDSVPYGSITGRTPPDWSQRRRWWELWR